MKYNWVDLILSIAAIIAFVRGYRAGFLKSIFTLLGFVGGGLAGLIIALQIVHGWHNLIGKFSLLLLAISVGSSIGEWLLAKVSKFFHNAILFGPFKWLDSILGAILSLLRTALTFYLIASLLLATPWQWAHSNIPTSNSYSKIKKITPAIIKELTTKINLN